MDPKELRDKAGQALASAKQISDRAKADKRDLTSEEDQQFRGLVAKAEEYRDQAATADRMAQLESHLNESRGRVSSPLPHQDPANTRQDRHAYSVLKAIRQSCAQREGKGSLDGLELEVHQEMQKRRGRPAAGVLLPYDLPIDPSRRSAPGPEARALDTTAGAGSIPTILSGTMIEALRARLVVRGLGATLMTDMQGLFAIPRQSGTGTVYWVSEGSTVTGSAQAVDQVAFSPKTVGCSTDYTRRFLEQTSLDSEQFVRQDLMAILARGVDTAALNGSGSSNQPTGVLQTSGIGSVALGTNGAAPTWAAIVGLESKVAVANADLGALAYCTNAATRGTLKTTPKIGSTFPTFLWNADSPASPLNGYGCGVTNLVPSNLTKGTGTNLSALIFGNWNDLVIAFWSGVDILVDPYTGGSAGTIRVIGLQDCDINVRHAASFAACVDVLNS